jgi:hypothetical protein
MAESLKLLIPLICKTFFEQWTHILLCGIVQPMTVIDVLRDSAAESIHFV